MGVTLVDICIKGGILSNEKHYFCICVESAYLSIRFMGIHECYHLSFSDKYCLRIPQPSHSELLAMNQHCDTCSAATQTLLNTHRSSVIPSMYIK